MNVLPPIRMSPDDSPVERPQIVLGRMPQQEEVRTAEDDWTGSTDAAERRKRQNRIHQRLYRKRRREKKLEQLSLPKCDTTSKPSNDASSAVPAYVNSPTHETVVASVQSGLPLNIAVKNYIDSYDKSSGHMDHLVQELAQSISAMCTTGSPRSDMLLTLIQFNVFRALVQNTFVSGFGFEWLDENAISHFNKNSHDWVCPPALQPTKLQREVEHHPWIDIFPFPVLRDNILRQGEEYDDSDLCYSLVELCHAPSGRNGLIVWGEPWDPAGWEVTEKFATDWAWILRGCTELLWSTNMWRRKRGERDIFFDVRPIEELD